jgi:CDP-diacylglycerol--glycerol-3-phosphate 3-phosphatidyltransferase
MKLNNKEIFTKSNLLSTSRLLLGIPIFFMVYQINNSQSIRYFTLGLMLIAALTDILDGYLARKYNEITEFGKIIDPLADKVVVGIVVLQLFRLEEIPAYYLIIIITRDLLILMGGIFVSKKIGKVLPSNIIGKITVISIALFVLITVAGLKILLPALYNILLYLSIILVFISIVAYTIRAVEALIRKGHESI